MKELGATWIKEAVEYIHVASNPQFVVIRVNQTCWDKQICPYYGGFFCCVLNLGSLIREVPLYEEEL